MRSWRESSPAELLMRVETSTRSSDRVRMWGLVFLALIAVAAAVAATMVGIRTAHRHLFVENPRYRIRHIDARSDGRLTAEQIIAFAGLAEASRLFEVDLEATWSNLMRLPAVHSAVVRRRPPDTLEVRVMERKPLARVWLPQAGYTDATDREGVLLGPRFAAPNLPMIRGLTEAGLRPGERLASPAARAALTALDLCESRPVFAYLRVRAADVSPSDHVVLELENGDRALLPLERVESKLKRLVTILKTIADQRLPRGPEPLEIDLTTEEVFPVRGLRVEALTNPRRTP